VVEGTRLISERAQKWVPRVRTSPASIILMEWRQQPYGNIGKSPQKSAASATFGTKTTDPGLLWTFLALNLCTQSYWPPREAVRWAVVHLTTGRSNVGVTLRRMQCAQVNRSQIWRGSIGQSRSKSYGDPKTCRENIAYNTLPYNFARMLPQPLFEGHRRHQ
jgi:hypothetical protein